MARSNQTGIARFVKYWAVLSVMVAQMICGNAGAQSLPFDSGRASFSVAYKDEIVRYRVLAAYVMPGEEVDFQVVDDQRKRSFQFDAPGGALLESAPTHWRWRAPESTGLYPVRIQAEQDNEAILLNIFVLVPISRVSDGWLNGYRIGNYPDKPLKGLDIYRQPVGFVEVTPENRETAVSPHFTLGQFLCKQESGYPKYLILKTRLLRKLEFVLQKVNAGGIRCDRLAVMSGYRTPWYNKVIGNVQYSRHVWGGAADIYVDESPRDGEMDDLNADGKIDYKDAAVFYKIVDDQYGDPMWAPFTGGLGQYRRTASHGPFVHVDVRGFRARWGD